MTYFFQFEADFVESLRCIPMQVRLKLDTSGVKLKLSHWHQLNQEERQKLVIMPCDTPESVTLYRNYLNNLILEKTGNMPSQLAIDPHPPWLNADTIPVDVQQKAAEFDLTLTISQWISLTPQQRFALIKLSRSNHENANFLPALKEFNLSK